MTTEARPATAPPISAVFIRQGEYQWVNPLSGHIVRWDTQAQVYQQWSPQTLSWSWWGPTRQGTQAWHSYGGARVQMADFWFCVAIGLVVLVACASQGFTSLGLIGLLYFAIWGAGWSWLHTKHPTVYSVAAVVGGVAVIASAVHHEDHS